MCARWDGVRAALVLSINTLEADLQFRLARAEEKYLVRFESPSALVEYLNNYTGVLDEKDSIYAALVRAVQRRVPWSDLATTILWLGLWPALDAIYRRNLRHFPETSDSLVSEIGERFTAMVSRADLTRINRVAATLTRNTERDIRSGLRRTWAARAQEDQLPDGRYLDALLSKEARQEGKALVKQVLRAVPDADLVMAVLVRGENQREAGTRLETSHSAARKRFQRALARARDALGVTCPTRRDGTAFPPRGCKARRR